METETFSYENEEASSPRGVESNAETTEMSPNQNTSEEETSPDEDEQKLAKTPNYTVDICATCLVNKPPKLPLREELPSLGFELIYNARGVGVTTSKYQSKQVVHNFRKETQAKEMTKRRWFPKSKRKIKKKIAAQAAIEEELKQPTALSYEAYEYGLLSFDLDEYKSGKKLLEKGESSFSDTASTCSTDEQYPLSAAVLSEGDEPKDKSNFDWTIGFAASRKNPDRPALENSGAKTEEKVDDIDKVLATAEFGDLLAPMEQQEPSKPQHNSEASSLFQVSTKPLKDSPEEEATMEEYTIDEFSEFQFVAEEGVGVDLPGFSMDDEAGNPLAVMSLQDDEMPHAKNTEGLAFDQLVRKVILGQEPNGSASPSDVKHSGTAKQKKKHNAFAKLFAVFTKPPKKSKQEKYLESSEPKGSNDLPVVGANDLSSTMVQAEDERIQKDQSSNLNDPETFDFLSPTDGDTEESDAAMQKEAAMSWVETTRLAFETVASGSLYEGHNIGESDLQPVTSPVTSQEGWLQSASEAIKTVTSDFVEAAGLVPSQDEQIHSPSLEERLSLDPNALVEGDPGLPIDSENARVAMIPTEENPLGFRSDLLAEVSLLEVIGSVDCHSYQVYDAIMQAPELAQVKQQDIGRYPLHTLCSRGMLDRSNVHESDLADFLLNDITGYKECITELMGAFPPAALVVDCNGDLPVHLLARTLMEWEACWYEIVYARAAKEKESNGTAAQSITSLYEAMSNCVEVVLRPITRDTELCQVPGSVGQIYPLHIAAIFTSSIQSLSSILESYPKAASILCDLDDLGTFIPDNSLPLVLHDSLSTDFPKWELGEKHSDAESPFEPVNGPEIRRSDLIFAYNPNVKPFRLDTSRIKRMEDRIRDEIQQIIDCNRTRLSQHMERFWVWLCTFQDLGSSRPAYSRSVKRVVKDLPLSAVHYLASITAPGGRTVLCDAAPKCAAAIRIEFERCPPIKVWESQAQMYRLLSGQQGFVAPFARTIFNIKERRLPTSFVVLPYRLESNDDGTVGVKDSSSFTIAAKFAECLLRLSDPRAILYYLDQKSRLEYGESLYEGSSNEGVRQRTFNSIGIVEAKLLKLYQPGKSFLYLLDEGSALPVVPKGETFDYPVILRDPGHIVKQLLPLMLPGMILMRGDKSLSVLINVILDSDVKIVPPNWIGAANNLSKFLSTRGKETFYEIDTIKDSVAQFLYKSVSLKKRNQVPLSHESEWKKETDTLKRLIDPQIGSITKYAGLYSLRNEGWALYWTRLAAEDGLESRSTGLLLGELAKKHEDLSEQLASLKSVGEKDLLSLASRSMNSRKDIELYSQPESVQVTTTSSDRAVQLSLSGDTPSAPSKSSGNIASSSRTGSTLLDENRSERNNSATYSEDTVPLIAKRKVRSDSEGQSLHFPTPPSDDSASSRYKHENIDDAVLRARSIQRSVGKAIGEHATLASSAGQESGYNMLFGDLSVGDRGPGTSEQATREAGSSSERIWNDITDNLDKGSMVHEDPEVIRLKLKLAEEAKRSGDLSRRVRDLTETTGRLVSQEEQLKEELLGQGVQGESQILPSLQQSRKLLIRLCDLEERLLCDEIDIQHLRMESLSMYYQIEEINVADGNNTTTIMKTDKSNTITEIMKPHEPPSLISSPSLSKEPANAIMDAQEADEGKDLDLVMSPSTKSTKSCTTDPGSILNPVFIATPNMVGCNEVGSCADHPLDLTAFEVQEENDDVGSQMTPLDVAASEDEADFDSATQVPSIAGTSMAHPVDLTDHSGTVTSWIRYHDSSGQIEI